MDTYVHHSHRVTEHRFDVPLDYSKPVGPGNPLIQLFARSVVKPGGEDLPWLVFLQGGPGGAGPRQGDFASGWLGRALDRYRVLLMDQRGTGQSTYLDAQSLGPGGPFSDLLDRGDPAGRDQQVADLLMLFRQDQIIKDAEFLRERIAGGQKWTTLGQSYGGFLTLAYLTQAPEAVEASLITGGLAGLTHIDDIYRLTYQHTAQRNRAYFAKFPDDEQTIRRIAAHLHDTEELLPTGERLSAQRFRMIGMSLGMASLFDELHYLLEGPWVSVGGEQRLSSQFLHQILPLVTANPMYEVLQEAIYAGATPELKGTATNWSAQRLANEVPGFAPGANPTDASEPFYLTGEHMFEAFWDEDPELRPLKGATEILAKRTDWPAVYDPDVLKHNKIPVAAAVYFDDMFVPRELSLETAELIGARTWVTNEYQHDGVRVSNGQVFDHLLDLVHD